jgi:acetone carboxylase gamma subunit
MKKIIEEIKRDTFITQQEREFVKCECGHFYSNPFKCVACGKERAGNVAEYTFLDSQDV